ncbi:MAG: hydroxymethylglutaryl-CoA reductase [Alphaproteobacteria bacterium]|nr:hydroxymethylglutaryl-CoA reductase [Alphaproteobacteria bacterium]
MDFQDTSIATKIPTKVVGSIKMVYDGIAKEVSVPLATFETPLWSSVKRGALVSQKTDGVFVSIIDDGMSRSSILEAENLSAALRCKGWIESHMQEIASVVESTSRFAKFKEIRVENVGSLLYIRLSVSTGNAAGHNMVTAAADEVLKLIISQCPYMKYVSISGNYCVDKKVSAVNAILGRGKRVSAEIVVPNNVCQSVLKTTPERIVDLNIKKNLIGSVLAGGVRSANAHYANILLAMYLATGQDAANIVEASQGVTFAEVRNGNLYFSVNMPNIIVGTIGNGKQFDFVQQNLEMMGCDTQNPKSSERLAAIIGAAVLCSELSLMAAQTNQGELMKTHIALERQKS